MTVFYINCSTLFSKWILSALERYVASTADRFWHVLPFGPFCPSPIKMVYIQITAQLNLNGCDCLQLIRIENYTESNMVCGEANLLNLLVEASYKFNNISCRVINFQLNLHRPSSFQQQQITLCNLNSLYFQEEWTPKKFRDGFSSKYHIVWQLLLSERNLNSSQLVVEMR